MATIKDIAKAAGVSVTTVSRALNGYSDVNAATKQKIKQVAEELAYRPNAVARSLVMKKTRTLGVIFSEIKRSGAKDAFAFEMLCGINDRASELDYDIILFSTNPKKQTHKTYADLCKERNVDGAVISGLRLDDPYVEEVVEMATFPCVLIDLPYNGKNLAHVKTDNVKGARNATEHLLKNGHTEIALINGHEKASVSMERLEGFRLAFEAAGLPYRPERVHNGGFSEEGAAEVMYQILLQDPGVTAVFCASDLMALGAIRTLEKVGKKVPDDMSVIGFDDISIAQYCSPKLTTIRQDKYDLGYQAARLLIDMLEGRQFNPRLTLSNELIIRESTRALDRKNP